VVLSGRLAHQIELDSLQAARRLTAFVADNYDRYRGRPIAKDELEPMLIVSRWLRERRADDGRLLFIDGPFVPLQAVLAHCPEIARGGASGPQVCDAPALPESGPVIQQRPPE
jgi:hypothetical protein